MSTRKAPVAPEEINPAEDVSAVEKENESLKSENQKLMEMLQSLNERVSAMEAPQPAAESAGPKLNQEKPYKKVRTNGGFEYIQGGKRFSASGELIVKGK